MINKKFGLILAGAVLSLAACGDDGQQTSEEQNAAAEETVVVEQEEETEEATTEDQDAGQTPEAENGTASDLLSNGEATSFAFNQTGEFSIFCAPHPVMKMTVIVEDGAEQSGEVELDITDYEFSEETVTVAPGTIITWTNQDQVQHNVAFE